MYYKQATEVNAIEQLVNPVVGPILAQQRNLQLNRYVMNMPTMAVHNDRVLTEKVLQTIPDHDQRQKLFQATNDPTAFGRLLTAGIAGLVAPLVIGKFSDNSTSSLATALQVLSIPVAAFGGATLYDILMAPKPQFTPSMQRMPFYGPGN
jgi:hypothetical protein